jgi:hypothetical protein
MTATGKLKEAFFLRRKLEEVVDTIARFGIKASGFAVSTASRV